MKSSFYQFYQKILKEAGGAPPAPQPPGPGTAPAGGNPPPGQAGAPGGAAPAGGAPAGGAPAAAGQGTSPPVPPPDQNLAQAVTMLSKVTDPKAKQMVDQFMKQLQGAGIQIPGSPTAPPSPAPAGKAPAPGSPPAPPAPGAPPAPPK